MAARQAALLLLLGAAAAQRTWQRAEAAAGGAVVSLPLPVVWDWAEDPGVAGYCATARGPEGTGGASVGRAPGAGNSAYPVNPCTEPRGREAELVLARAGKAQAPEGVAVGVHVAEGARARF